MKLCRLIGHRYGPVPAPWAGFWKLGPKAGFPYPDWYAGPTEPGCMRCAKREYKRLCRKAKPTTHVTIK